MQILHAGPLQMYYKNGFLRYMRQDDVEVLRMLYFAVRDENWNTIPLHILHEEVNIYADHFSIHYEGRCQQNRIDYAWKCNIEGNSDGSITFEIHGEALSDFLRNRIGFCVLHPIKAYAGRAVTITHTNHTTTNYIFPKYIDPYQPFKDIQAMRWTLGHNTYSIQFQGDIFETEDQRNWLDASFKTYCTPLHLPFPAQVIKGDKVYQKVEFRVEDEVEIKDEVEIEIENEEVMRSMNLLHKNKELYYTLSKTNENFIILPLGLEANAVALDDVTITHLKNLNLSFLRVEMRLHEANWETDFNQRLQQAQLLALPIHLVLFLNKDWEYEKKLLEEYNFPITIQKIITIDVNNKTLTAPFLEKVLPVLKSIFPDIPIGGGTNAYFTEFNRNPPPASLLDFSAFSVNPQVHAFDELSLIENLETPPYIIASAQKLINLPVSVSPITLRPRFNPDATAPEKTLAGQLPFRVDARQRTDFAAVWTLGSILAFTEAGAQDLTYYQTVNEMGVMMSGQASEYHDFPADAYEIFPLYHVFKLFGAYQGGTVEILQSSHPLLFAGFIIKHENKQLLALVNYTPESIEIQAFNEIYLLQPYQILLIS
ncbi:MAG: hypothetical protein ACK4TA_19630 [Saprospiraceae bacterium]